MAASETKMMGSFGLPGHILGIEMHWFLSAGRRGCLLRGVSQAMRTYSRLIEQSLLFIGKANKDV